MRRAVKVLLVEDPEPIADQFLEDLKKGAFDVSTERVDRAGAAGALDKPWDLVIVSEPLPESERRASVGTLAGEVAHEINNPLAALMANLHFIQEDFGRLLAGARTEGNREAVQILEKLDLPIKDCQESAERIRKIVEDLRILSRGNEPRTEPPVSSAEAAPPVPPRTGRILVVDDEPMLGPVIRRVFSQHDVQVCTRAKDALARLLAGESFDVILCDLMMPDLSGMELHAALQARAPGQVRCLVFMTGGAFTADARAFLDAVQNPVVSKPLDMAALRALVQRMIAA